MPTALRPSNLQEYERLHAVNHNVYTKKLRYSHVGVVFLVCVITDEQEDVYSAGSHLYESYSKDVEKFFKTIGFKKKEGTSIRWSYELDNSIAFYIKTDNVEPGVVLEV